MKTGQWTINRKESTFTHSSGFVAKLGKSPKNPQNVAIDFDARKLSDLTQVRKLMDESIKIFIEQFGVKVTK